jgi:hypothetical protein
MKTEELEKLTSATYKVEFNANGGVGWMPTQIFTYSETKPLVANRFICVGCTFQGWTTSESGAVLYKNEQRVSSLAPVGETITLYAVWYVNSYATLRKPYGSGAPGAYAKLCEEAFALSSQESDTYCAMPPRTSSQHIGQCIPTTTISE